MKFLLITCVSVILHYEPATATFPTCTDPIDSVDIIAEPQNSTITVLAHVGNPSTVHITLYNLLGQQEGSWDFNIAAAGFHELQLTGLELPSGAYFVSIEYSNRRLSRKVLYVR